jgi:hypothetical protein
MASQQVSPISSSHADSKALIDFAAFAARLKKLRKNAENPSESRKENPAGAEALIDFAAFAARLKSCPDTNSSRGEFFRSL